MPDPPEPTFLDPEVVARMVQDRRDQDGRRKVLLRADRWLTTGWGGVGVRWCGECARRFDGAAYVYDDLFGKRNYYCGRCYRRHSDLYVAAIPKPCEVCGREFAWIGGQLPPDPSRGIRARPRPRTHVCSDFCRRARRMKARRVRHEKRECAGCRRSFVPTRADQLYHSAACRQRAYRRRRGA